MAPQERRDEEGEETLRVTDRRRFTEDGDVREAGAAGAPNVSDAAPASPARAAEPRPPARGSEPAVGVPPPGASELGIETVFLAFWQGALMNLGAADPTGARHPVNLEAARESIELLRVLQAKTSGNLSPEEASMLRHLLHEAQVAYVQVAGAAGGGGEGESP